MDKDSFNRLLLETAFVCTAADGVVEEGEVEALAEFAATHHLADKETLNILLSEWSERFNREGTGFMKSFLNALPDLDLSRKEKIRLLEMAALTAQIDHMVWEGERTFFKLLFYKLDIKESTVLRKVKGIDESYLPSDDDDEDELYEEYFNSLEIDKIVRPHHNDA